MVATSPKGAMKPLKFGQCNWGTEFKIFSYMWPLAVLLDSAAIEHISSKYMLPDLIFVGNLFEVRNEILHFQIFRLLISIYRNHANTGDQNVK